MVWNSVLVPQMNVKSNFEPSVKTSVGFLLCGCEVGVNAPENSV